MVDTLEQLNQLKDLSVKELRNLFQQITDEEWKKEARNKLGAGRSISNLSKKHLIDILKEAVKNQKLEVNILVQAIQNHKDQLAQKKTKRKRSEELEEIVEKVAKRICNETIKEKTKEEATEYHFQIAKLALDFSMKIFEKMEKLRNQVNQFCNSTKINLPHPFQIDNSVYEVIKKLSNLSLAHPLLDCRDHTILSEYIKLSKQLYDAAEKQLINMIFFGFQNLTVLVQQLKLQQNEIERQKQRISELEQECEGLCEIIEKMKKEQEEIDLGFNF